MSAYLSENKTITLFCTMSSIQPLTSTLINTNKMPDRLSCQTDSYGIVQEISAAFLTYFKDKIVVGKPFAHLFADYHQYIIENYYEQPSEIVTDFSLDITSEDSEEEIGVNWTAFKDQINGCIYWVGLVVTPLSRSLEFFDKVQEMASVGGWEVDVQKNEKMFWSRQIFDIFGLPYTKVPPVIDTFAFFHPEDRPTIERVYEECVTKGIPYDKEIRFINAKKEHLWVRSICFAEKDESGKIVKLRGTFQDITRRKHSEIELAESWQFYEQVVENYLNGAVIIYDANLKVVKTGGTDESFISLFPQDGSGTMYDEANINGLSKYVGIYKEATEGDKFVFEEEINGQHYVINILPFINGISRSKYGILLARNVTSERQLILEKNQAEQATAAKTQFLSHVSHEIRTPLNAVIGLIDILSMDNKDNTLNKKFSILKFSADNLLSIINDILDLTKIESGKYDFEEIDFSIRYLIDGVKNTFQHKVEEKGIGLKFIIDHDLPEMVMGDPVRLMQVLNNLVGNAVKFTDHGNVTVTISVDSITDHELNVHFRVQDTGIGIPADKLENIFESFVQAESETTRRFGGTGLGLTITKKLLELQGSQIQLESEYGKGSAFYFTLTIKQSERTNNYLIKGAKLKREEENNNLEGCRVLLVDDNEVNQFIACEYMHKWNVEVICANDGQEALETIQQKGFDIVLMDLQMPKMNGYEATEAIRSLDDEYFKKVPVIALTADALASMGDKLDNAGIRDFMVKPFDPDILQEKLSYYYNRKSDSKEQESSTKQEVNAKEELISFEQVNKMISDKPEVKKQFIEMSSREFTSFVEKYAQALRNRDKNEYHRLKHRIIPTIRLFNFQAFHEEIAKGQHLVYNEVTTLVQIEESIDRIYALVEEFKTEVAVFGSQA